MRAALRRAGILSALLGGGLALSSLVVLFLGDHYAYGTDPFTLGEGSGVWSYPGAMLVLFSFGLAAAPAAVLDHLVRTRPGWSGRARLASWVGLLAPFALTAFVIGNLGYVTTLHATRSFEEALAGTGDIFFDPRFRGLWFFVIALAHAIGIVTGMRLQGESLARQCVFAALRSALAPLVLVIDTGIGAAPRYLVFMTALGAVLPLLWRLTDRIEARFASDGTEALGSGAGLLP